VAGVHPIRSAAAIFCAQIHTQRKAMMKKTLLAVAVLGTFAGSAAAQSSVTLYGVADANVERIKGATSLNRISSGGVQGSRWGLRGTEDLGGGLRAVFQLESGFNIDTGTSGQGGALFGRQAYVGLAGGFGAVRLGRQYSPMDDVAGMVGTKTYDVLSVVPIIGNGDYNRVNNAITYLTPKLGGFTAQVQYSLGEERASSNTSKDFGKQYSMHAMYSGGPLSAGLSVMRVIDGNGTIAGKQDLDAVLLVGAYDFGFAKFTAYYDQEDRLTGTAKMKVYGLSAAVPFGSTTLALGAAQAKNVLGSTASGDDANLFTVQLTHNLSKRTALYAHFTAVDNDSAASLGFNSPTAGSNSNGVQFGVRHRF
jgi:GBP family porin